MVVRPGNKRINSLRIPSGQFEFLRSLIKKEVRFVVIGGYALRFFGCERPTRDLDILIDNGLRNVKKLRPIVVDYLGYEPKFTLEDFLKPRQQLKIPDGLIDILTSVDSLNFDLAYEAREQQMEDGTVIPIVSKKDLIFIKESAATDPKRREKELKDIEYLKRN